MLEKLRNSKATLLNSEESVLKLFYVQLNILNFALFGF